MLSHFLWNHKDSSCKEMLFASRKVLWSLGFLFSSNVTGFQTHTVWQAVFGLFSCSSRFSRPAGKCPVIYVAPTADFNPITWPAYNMSLTKGYFTRHGYLSREHNSNGLRKVTKQSKLNIIQFISEGLIGYNGIHLLQH